MDKKSGLLGWVVNQFNRRLFRLPVPDPSGEKTAGGNEQGRGRTQWDRSVIYSGTLPDDLDISLKLSIFAFITGDFDAL